MEQQSSQFHQAGEQIQLNIMKECFPDLANQMSSSNIKPRDYVVNGKVVGLVEDFGAVQFIMYTDPWQRRIIRTEFKFK